MNDIISTLLKSLIAIAVLYLLARLMGKKQVSQLTFFDYVVGISIGSIAAAFAVDPSVNYIEGIAGMAVFAVFPLALSYISMKHYGARKLLDGKPIILIQDGKIMEKALKKSKINVNDLLEECRQKDAFDIADVAYAVFEASGKVSVLKKAPAQPPTRRDMKISIGAEGLCTNIIVDGHVLCNNLQLLGKDAAWLDEELKKQGAPAPEDILHCYIDAANRIHIDRKNRDPAPTPLM